MSKVFAAFANGVWFKVEKAEHGDYCPHDREVDEKVMCKGCLFDKKGSDACTAAGAAALAAGLPDCESKGYDPGYRYVRDPSDGRQFDVIESAS
jgi:hypothetical protein